MLQYMGMNSTVQWWLAVGTLTCLISFPQMVTFSTGLRDEAVAYRGEGYQRQQQGDKEGALATYQKAAALDPTYPLPQNDMGILFEEMGRLEDAKHAYEQALAINPNYLDAHSNLALLHEQLGEKEQAIFHWLKRYQLGDAEEVWTARAEERLVALGVLKAYPGLKGKIYTRQKLVRQELKEHERSLKEFQKTTEQFERW